MENGELTVYLLWEKDPILVYLTWGRDECRWAEEFKAVSDKIIGSNRSNSNSDHIVCIKCIEYEVHECPDEDETGILAPAPAPAGSVERRRIPRHKGSAGNARVLDCI